MTVDIDRLDHTITLHNHSCTYNPTVHAFSSASCNFSSTNVQTSVFYVFIQFFSPTLNDLPGIIITALSTGHLLEEVKLHPTDAAVPVQINAVEDLLQSLPTSLRQRHLPSLPLLDQWDGLEGNRVVIPRLQVAARRERDEGIGTSVQV